MKNSLDGTNNAFVENLDYKKNRVTVFSTFFL